MKKILLLLILLPNLAFADSWISGGYTLHRPEANDSHSGGGFTIAGKIDREKYYLRAYYSYGEVESFDGYTGWDLWFGHHVFFDEGHIFDQTATLELGKTFFHGFIAAVTLDVIHVDQRSNGYSGTTGFEHLAAHQGYKKDYWQYGTGWLIGYGNQHGKFAYQFDIGHVDHFTSDIRFRTELAYEVTDTLSVFFELRDYDEISFTEYDLGVRYHF